MSSPQPFDPYYEWLAIPPAEQPPHLYRLLGLQKYEPDLQVIEHAADRQMLFLRQFQSSPRWHYAEALLNTIARAKIELLDPLRKRAYDQALWEADQAVIAASQPLHSPQAVAVRSSAESAAAKEAVPMLQPAAGASAATPGQHRRTRPSSRGYWGRLIGVVLGGPTGILIGLWLANILGLNLPGIRPKPDPGNAPDATALRPAQPAPLFEPLQRAPPPRTEVRPSPPPVASEGPDSSPVASEEETIPNVEPTSASVAAPAEIVPALPASVELPPTTVTAAATLFSTPDNAAPLEWSVRCSTAVPSGSGSFLLRRANSDPQRWNILFSPDAASTDQAIPIARLLTPPGAVQFQWTTASGDEAYQLPLVNCLLEAKAGTQMRTIQLRRPLALAPLALDLDQDDSSVEFELSDLPPPDALLLEVSALPKGGAFEEGTASAKPGKSVVIQFAELSGAEISLRMQQKGTNPGKFIVRAKPEFVEGPRQRFELTRPKLAEMTKRWTEMGQKAALTIKQTQTRIAALKNQLEDLEDVSGNMAVMAERARQMNAVGERMKVEADRLPTHRKRLIEAQARLKAVPTVEKFLASHDQSSLPFRVLAQVGQDRIVLAESR